MSSARWAFLRLISAIRAFLSRNETRRDVLRRQVEIMMRHMSFADAPAATAAAAAAFDVLHKTILDKTGIDTGQVDQTPRFRLQTRW